ASRTRRAGAASMTTKRVAMAVLAVLVVVVLAWVGFLVYAEQPGAGEAEMADHSEHEALLAAPKAASNAQARLAVTIDPQEGAQGGDPVALPAKVAHPAGPPDT